MRFKKETRNAIIRDYLQGESIEAIREKYGVQLKEKTLQMWSKKYDTIAKAEQKEQKEVVQRVEIQPVQEVLIAQSTGINVLQGIIFSVNEVLDINRMLKSDIDGLHKELKRLKRLLQKNTALTSDEKKKLGTAIEMIEREAVNFYPKIKLRLEALNTLQRILTVQTRQEAVTKYFDETAKLINDVFRAMNVLDDNNYQRYRDELLKLQPALQSKFVEYEQYEVTND